MNVGDVVKRVRAAIDELMVNDSGFLLSSEDEKNLRAVIVDKIGYALQWVFENAPDNLLDATVFSTLTEQEAQGFAINASLIGRLRLPTDLLRIIDAKLSSWAYCPTPVDDRSEIYMMQQNEYTRGTYDRPVSVLTYDGGVKYLEMYSAKSVADTLQFTFIRKPSAAFDADTKDSVAVNIPARLELPFIYHIAGLTMVTMREEIATPLLQLASQYIGISKE